MATHSSILALRIPMDKGTWQTSVHGDFRQASVQLCKELDTTEQLSTQINLLTLFTHFLIPAVRSHFTEYSSECLDLGSVLPRIAACLFLSLGVLSQP